MLNATCGVSVGLCAEYDVRGGFQSSQVDIVVAEDDGRVVVFATVCTPVLGEDEPAYEGPWHVYLDGPLGERTVIDGSSGTGVPYKNVYEELRRDGAQ